MITLNGERGLVKIESWSDVENLPGFDKNVDPRTVKLDQIIGKYREPDEKICGLSTCHHKHYRGYLVTTKDKRVTNIGKDCGKTHFSVEFETLSSKFDKDILDQERRETITAAKNRLDGYLRQIKELRSTNKGADWLNKQMTLLRSPIEGLPYKIYRQLEEMVRNGSPILKRQRRATKSEIEAMRATGRLSEDDHRTEIMLEDEVGVLNGFDVLYPENDIRQNLILELEKWIEHLQVADVYSASSHQLGVLAKQVSNIEPKLEVCRRIVAQGAHLFERENLIQLAELVENAEDEKQIMTFARRY